MNPDFMEFTQIDKGSYISFDNEVEDEVKKLILDSFQKFSADSDDNIATEQENSNVVTGNNKTTQEDYITVKVKKRVIHPAEIEDPNATIIGLDKEGYLTADPEKITELIEVFH